MRNVNLRSLYYIQSWLIISLEQKPMWENRILIIFPLPVARSRNIFLMMNCPQIKFHCEQLILHVTTQDIKCWYIVWNITCMSLASFAAWIIQRWANITEIHTDTQQGQKVKGLANCNHLSHVLFCSSWKLYLWKNKKVKKKSKVPEKLNIFFARIYLSV